MIIWEVFSGLSALRKITARSESRFGERALCAQDRYWSLYFQVEGIETAAE